MAKLLMSKVNDVSISYIKDYPRMMKTCSNILNNSKFPIRLFFLIMPCLPTHILGILRNLRLSKDGYRDIFVRLHNNCPRTVFRVTKLVVWFYAFIIT